MAASISLSMFTYWHSVLVRALLAKAMGLPFCRSAAPRPTCETLTCIVMGSEGSKYLRVGVTDNSFFYMLKSGIIGPAPSEVCVLLEQLMQGGSQGGQTRDEGTKVHD